jgi:hypothetical protein
VKDCQWSWQSLEDGPNGPVTPVKEYPAFGDEVTDDCSVRFSSLLAQQEGFWICGIRGQGVGSFINSPPAKIVAYYGGKFNKLYESGEFQVLMAAVMYLLPSGLLQCVV